MNKKRKINMLKQCRSCGQNFILEDGYFPTNSVFFPDGYLDVCNICIGSLVDWEDFGDVDKLCRYADWAFLVDEYSRLMQQHREKAIEEYGKLFFDVNYRSLGWKEQNEKLLDVMNRGQLELEIEALRPSKLREYRLKWGAGYEEDQYIWLENYYIDMEQSYDIQTASHRDYLRKVCKISMLMEKELNQEGTPNSKVIKEFGELLDKMMKSAEFTQAGTKNRGGLSSLSEFVDVLERHGFKANFYDDTPRDIIDQTIDDIQTFNRRLIIEEHGLRDMVESAIAIGKAKANREAGIEDDAGVEAEAREFLQDHASDEEEIRKKLEDLDLDDEEFQFPL